MSKITVVGGGVSGLTTAIRLAEAGHDVSVVARDYLVGTTSWVATAIWHLFWVKIDARVERWAVEALTELIRLADDPAAGITQIRGIECVRAGTPEAAEFEAGVTGALWKKVVPYQPLTRDELIYRLPKTYPVDTLLGGYVITVPIADMSVYLPYLMGRLDKLNVSRNVATFASLDEVREQHRADWYVNCTGLGSRDLVSDTEIKGVKGQIIRVSRDGSITEYIADDFSPTGMTYILPRGNDVVLGGSEELGVENSDVDPELAEKILLRCANLVPEVANAEVLEHMAGVRPFRASIRLEIDAKRPDVIHNYGHGGSGVSLSWGCSQEVLNLIGDGERQLSA